MNVADRWLLPEGIEEVLPPQAARLERLRRRLLDLYSSWGYDLVMPPFIEYLEALLVGTGNDLDLQTFKLIDQLTGRKTPCSYCRNQRRYTQIPTVRTRSFTPCIAVWRPTRPRLPRRVICC